MSLDRLAPAPGADAARKRPERAEAEVIQADQDGAPRFQDLMGRAPLSGLPCLSACLDQFAFDGDEDVEIELGRPDAG